MLSHNNLLWTTKRAAEAMGIEETDRSLSFLPFSHITQQLLSIYIPIFTGSRGTTPIFITASELKLQCLEMFLI